MRFISTNKVFSLIISIFFGSCVSDNSPSATKVRDITTDTITHYNIIVAPDISNRIKPELYPKPVDDQDIIKMIFRNIDNILGKKRKTHQHDIFRVDVVNKQLISAYGIEADELEINFHEFGDDQLRRIDFVTGVNKLDNLEKRTTGLLTEVNKMYQKGRSKSFGADIWSYIGSGYNLALLGPTLATIDLEDENMRIVNQYRNILVILTDGYIETGYEKKDNCSGNLCNYLTGTSVTAFRKAYKTLGKGKDLERFFKENGYGITPVKNPALSNTEVLVLELYDRSVTPGGISTDTPSDSEILNLFWNDWLTKSKAKRHDIYSTASSIHDVEKAFKSFLEL